MIFFFPHHGVWKESSETTKLETVFNGSIRKETGASLNALLYVGPNLLPSLLDLVRQWRSYRFVFSADVEKMFRQISVDPSDQHFQSILWRYNRSGPFETYWLTTVTYGLTSSSFLASQVVKQIARDYQHRFPLGSKTVSSEVYMDDVLSGAHTKEEALLKQKETIRILSWLPSEILASKPKSLPEEGSVTSKLSTLHMRIVSRYRWTAHQCLKSSSNVRYSPKLLASLTPWVGCSRLS